MKEKIRVLYLTHDDRMRGGANRSLLTLIQCVKMEVEAIVVTTRKAEIYHCFTKAGIRCLVLPVPQHIQSSAESFLVRLGKYPFRFVKKALQKRQLLRGIHKCFPLKGDIDIVHTNTAVVSVGQAVAQILGAHHVWHLREYVNLDHGLKLMGTWTQLRRAVALSDATIAISKSVQRHFLPCPKPLDVCIYNAVVAVSSQNMIPLSKGREKAFLFVGTLCASKGAEDALEAFIRFHSDHPDWILYMIGAGESSYEYLLKKKCVDARCEDVVHFLGFCENPYPYYFRCRAFLMCSRMEALGRTTIEALDSGCIPIGHDTGGTSELIESGVTGFLYQTDEELLQAMNLIATTSHDEMIKNAHDFAQHNFVPNSYGNAVVSLYRQLIEIK